MTTEMFWDSISEKYDKAEKRFKQIHLKTIENAKKYLLPNNNVLNYGCATGTKTLALAGYVKKIYGIDISAKMIETAKARACENSLEDVIVEDLLKGVIMQNWDVFISYSSRDFSIIQKIIPLIIDDLTPDELPPLMIGIKSIHLSDDRMYKKLLVCFKDKTR